MLSGRLFVGIVVCCLMILASATVWAEHSCDEGHFVLENVSTSVDPPRSCLGLSVVGEMKACQHARLRIENNCDHFVKFVDGTQAYCQLQEDSEPSECQVIAKDYVGYVDIPWRKVVATDDRQEARYDIQMDTQSMFLFVSFDSREATGEDDGGSSDDDGVCTTQPGGGAAPLSGWLVAGVLLAVGWRRVWR